MIGLENSMEKSYHSIESTNLWKGRSVKYWATAISGTQIGGTYIIYYIRPMQGLDFRGYIRPKLSC